MAQVTTYRTVRSMSNEHDQVLAKVGELLRDLQATSFGLTLINMQMLGGKLYLELSDSLPNPEPGQQAWEDYYEIEKLVNPPI